MDSGRVKTILKEASSYVFIILLVIIIRIFIFDPVKVEGPSMDTTLADGQILVLDKFTYKKHDIKRYDIVVIKLDTGKRIIKRVIGLPNEVVEIKDNKIYIDGKEIDDPYPSSKAEDFTLSEIGLEKVPGDSYFVLGDNRKISLDSRYNIPGNSGQGTIKKERIIGKASLRIWPLNKFGKVK